MSNLPETTPPSDYDRWSRVVASLLCCPWQLVEVQYRTGLRIMESMFAAAGGAKPAARPAAADELGRLQRLLAERIGRGLPPPKEVYQAPYRSRIDWSAIPEWARPSDPDLFEGCGHEG
jgi:hypothetical protein